MGAPASAATRRSVQRARIELRVSSEVKELVQRAAALEGTTTSHFLVQAAKQAAEHAIREHEVIRLSLEDSRVFAEALLNPSPPNERMRAAWADHLENVEQR